MRQDDDFLQDDLDDEKTIEFIKNYLPQDLKNKFTDDEFYYFLDLIDEYYTQSGILDAQPDAEGCIEIDLEKVVDYMVKEARKDGMGEYDPEELPSFVIPASAAAGTHGKEGCGERQAQPLHPASNRLTDKKICFRQKPSHQNITTYRFFAYLCPANRTERNEITLNK